MKLLNPFSLDMLPLSAHCIVAVSKLQSMLFEKSSTLVGSFMDDTKIVTIVVLCSSDRDTSLDSAPPLDSHNKETNH